MPPASSEDPDPPVLPVRPGPAAITAVAVGGVAGAEARYGLAVGLPHTAGTWPWATLLTNLLGCLLLGVLMVVLLEVLEPPHPLLRPFFGVGVLGGFTTFSTFALDADTLLHEHRVGVALGYLAITLVGGVVAVVLGTGATRALAGRR